MLDVLFKMFDGNALEKSQGVSKYILDLVSFYKKEFPKDEEFNQVLEATAEMIKSQKAVVNVMTEGLPDQEAQ